MIEFFAARLSFPSFFSFVCSWLWLSIHRVADLLAPYLMPHPTAFRNSNTSEQWRSFNGERVLMISRSRIFITTFGFVPLGYLGLIPQQ